MFFARRAEAAAGVTPVAFDWRWFGLALAALGAYQLSQVQLGYYLDSDDWFVLQMGREVCTAPRWDHFTRFWTDEPTWRPLLTARAAVEWCLFGASPFPRYALNGVLHLGCAVALARLVGRLGYSAGVRWAVGLFYAAHPIHAEALGWHHSGFEGITVDLLVLLAVHAAASGARWQSLLWAQAALLARENAVVAVPLIGLVTALRTLPGQRIVAAARAMLPGLIVVVVNVAVRVLVLQSASGRTMTGSFHWVEHPLAAIGTTLLHPWLPVHPALEVRALLWVVFASLPVIYLTVGGRPGLRVLGVCLLAYAVLVAPFVPVFHEATRFFEAAPGGIEQRWYFFHLPVAALVIWPAVVLAERLNRGAFIAVVASTTGLFLLVQSLDVRWWIERSVVSEAMAQQVRDGVRGGARSIGLRPADGHDDAWDTDVGEQAAQVFLNAAPMVGRGWERGLRVFRQGEDGLEEAVPATVGRRWARIAGPAPITTRWWAVDVTDERLRGEEPRRGP